MKLRSIFLAIGLAGLAVVIFLNLHQLKSFFHILSTLKWYVLVLVVIVQILSYFLNGLYYRSILRVFNYHNIGIVRLFEGAIAANFVNYIIPSAGFAGAGFFSQVLYPDVPRGKGVLVQFMRYGLSALAVLVMLPVGIGLVLITSKGNSNINHLAIVASLAILAVALTIAYLINQEAWVRKAINWLEHRFKRLFRKIPKDRLEDFIDEFYLGFHTMVAKKSKMIIPFGWSLVYIIVEMLTLYLVFLAFGQVVNPGIVIMGYLVANITSVLGGTFFSFGVFELGMVGTFVALGESFALSLSITLVYRVLNLIIGLPPGFYFYRKILLKA